MGALHVAIPPMPIVPVARALPRAWWVVVAALALLALALVSFVGGVPAAVTFVLGLALVAFAVTRIAAVQDRVALLAAVVLAFLVRALVAGGLEAVLQIQSPGSMYAPDEAVYLGAGRALAEHLRDLSAPFDASDPHLRMLYVQLIAVVFAVVGPNVLVIKLLDSFAGTFAPLLLYKAMRNAELPSARAATIVVLFFPSLLFWSTLALKDAYVELCVLAAIWTSSELVRTRNYWWLAATVLPLLALESVRRYTYFALALALLAVPLAFHGARERLRAAVAVAATVAILFAIFDPLSDAGPNPLYLPILTRGTSAEGARSAFVEPFPVVRGDPGDRFIVAVASQTPVPGATGRVVEVAAGSELVVEGAAPRGQGPYTVVRPGDTVVIAAPPGGTPAPAPQRTPEKVVLNPEAKNLVGPSTLADPDQTSIGGSLLTNITNLPLGMLYMAFAPFPWTAQRLTEIATIPEMLLWYVLLVLAIVGGVTLLRRGQFAFVHGAVFLGGMFVALSLIAASTGTLIRSRAMLIPFVVALAAVGAAAVLRDRLPPRVRELLD